MNKRLPAWFKQEIPDGITFGMTGLLAGLKVNTVCKEANCPNLTRCFNSRQATFMILGDRCTRSCRFCAVKRSGEGLPAPDSGEPARIAEAVKLLGLTYVVITSVTRDDLTDGGASQFALTVQSIRRVNPATRVELLIPDFLGDITSLKTIAGSGSSLIGHNLETVEALHNLLKPRSNYKVSLRVLTALKKINPLLLTKSSIMLGLGETSKQIIAAMEDLKNVSCDILVLGQYLAPSPEHYPVKEFIPEEEFARYRALGLRMGFRSVLSGPLVRSSYQAQKIYEEAQSCMI